MCRAAAEDLAGTGEVLETNGHVARFAHERHVAGPASHDRRARVNADPRSQLQPVRAAEAAGERFHLLANGHGRVRRPPGAVLERDRVAETDQQTALVALHHGPVEAARRDLAGLLKAAKHARLVLGIQALEIGLGLEHLAAAHEDRDLTALGFGSASLRGRRRSRLDRNDRGRAAAGPPRHGRDALRLGERRLLQCGDELLRGLEPLLRRLLDAPPDDAVEGRRNAPARRRQVGRLLVEDGGHRVRGRVLLERFLAGEQLVEDRPEREDVRAVVDGVAAHLLGGHVPGGPHDRAGLREVGNGGHVPASSATPERFARPKSRILTWPSARRNRLSGFRSRWTTPFL